VAIDGRAIVIPGESFSGKTTLVSALLRRGATYLSDEFAVLDRDGRVHPYPKPLSMRLQTGLPDAEVTPEAVGAEVLETSAPVALIVVTQYLPGATFEPRELSGGEAALALLGNAVPARERPAETMRAVREAAACSRCVSGERGDADVAAGTILALLAG
jgi:hypothetical protein